MTLTDLFLSQVIDPFRFGMLVFLFLTMLRTRASSGTLIPLAAGALFVAVLIPMTMTKTPMGPDLYRAVAVGIVTNALVIGAIALLYRMLPKRG